MAEGMLGGMLGGEEEKPEVEAAESLAGAEAFAAAVAAKLAGGDPGVARKTEEFLSEQTELLKVQKEHLKEEHAARLHYLRGQAREVDIRRFGLRLRIGFQLFVALVATVIGVGGAVMIHDAVTSRSVVVEAFDSPPALTAQGLTGRVVAAGVLDELNRLQAVTKTSAAKRDVANAWAGEAKLAVPEAGISFEELSSMLKARFGHDLHIYGDVVETDPGSVALTVRGDGVMPKTFTGTSRELSKLSVAAAEYVYGQSEPALWAAYLSIRDRYAESIAFAQSAYLRADRADRPYLLNSWAIALESSGAPPREALALYREALRLKPDFWTAYGNAMNSSMNIGDEEGAVSVAQELLKAAGGRPGRAPETSYANWDLMTWNLQAWLAGVNVDIESHGGIGTLVASSGTTVADVELRLHDSAAAELALSTTVPDDTDPTIAAVTAFVRGRAAAEASDTIRAVSEMETFGRAFTNPAVGNNFSGYSCWIAPAEEAAGHPDKADAVLKSAGTYVDCYRFRADILDGRGDWQGAQEWYSKSVTLAPDLPAGYYSWGVALAKHGDVAGAEAKFKHANQRGPHWADPLKAWGDVLVKQGQTKDALAKYDEALEYAPNWKQLKEAREAVTKQKM
jgi:tetratricopeptide (TPR) repeat protein